MTTEQEDRKTPEWRDIDEKYKAEAYGKKSDIQLRWMANKLQDLLDFPPSAVALGHMEKALSHLQSAGDT